MPRRALITVAAMAAMLATAAPAPAIVGGQPATQPYPYAVQLYADDDFICGGSLVRAQWVLTAAHCVDDSNGDVADPGSFDVRLGRVRLSDDGGETFTPTQVVQHEDWDSGGFDVALLKLPRSSGQTPVGIAGLEQADLWAPGDAATVIGWGATSNGGDASNELREVQVPIQSDQQCSMVNGPFLDYTPEREFCAGETTGGRDSCQGDSGGPLLVRDAQGAYLQAGVVSAGLGCALPAAYGLYARIGADPLNAWLRSKLPAATSGPGPGAGPGGQATTLTIRKRLRRKGGRLRVRIAASAPVTALTVRVRRRGRTVARGSAATFEGTRTLRLKLRRRAPRGSYRVVVRATDASGARIGASRTARR